MKPILKNFDCVDHDPIDRWEPRDLSEVNDWLCLHVGSADEEGADLFYVNVLSVEAVRVLPGNQVKQQKKLVLANYSWGAVLEAVRQILEPIACDDWQAITDKLRVHFDWEYEGMS